MIIVRLDCTPPIVNDVLTMALDDLPDVRLVADSRDVPDVVVVSAFDGIGSPLDWVRTAGPARQIVVLDSVNNILRVRGGNPGDTGERIIAGTMGKLRHVLQELSQARSRETAPRWSRFGT